MTARNAGCSDYEPGAMVRFGLAYERLAAQDEAMSEWLNQRARQPDPDEGFEIVTPEAKSDRCRVRGCPRVARALGMCERCYRKAKRLGVEVERVMLHGVCACGCGREFSYPSTGLKKLYATSSCQELAGKRRARERERKERETAKGRRSAA